ncbi:2-amino-4-hydroxy-6-hydroxymethyldihydropteridine diphosphokinase [Barnesiella propionica]|uniref:2-amino-4-hydroxy-6- hydroxymethyldihydropteridine diphosphokinase n=1 Tax=Barnesiella propionica TaxID=2981781 RepID=UPI0011C70C82|nr:2-amino-4-hydroxy-6-hydroxymethyldihydropteridine diphosphokinase [Barnesiella propionica]MCU6769380.1 2-amino-4-hydroxy-6-hydroxymethyldihydropteridine diphosphokinase [Barnesiella propionica]
MNRVIISIASNTPDKQDIMTNCINTLCREYPGILFSSCYNSRALNPIHPDYLNAVAIFKTKNDYEAVYSHLKIMETEAGRTPESKKTNQIPLDLDIIIWNKEVKKPRDLSYEFVLKGIEELAKLQKRNKYAEQ